MSASAVQKCTGRATRLDSLRQGCDISQVSSSIKLLSRLGLLALALSAAACSNSSTPTTASVTTTTTTGTTTSTPATTCAYTLSATTASVGPVGGTNSVTVTTTSGCAWTATTSSSFVSIQSGGSGSGNGTVVLNVAQNPLSTRTATATIAGQTFTLSQTGAGLIVGFNMFDPPSQADGVTICRIRGPAAGSITTCPLTSTSRTTGTNALATYLWTVQYTYNGVAKTNRQDSNLPDFFVSEFCGLSPATASGTAIPITVSLTITDSDGVQATATSGVGGQPALQIVAYTCGS